MPVLVSSQRREFEKYGELLREFALKLLSAIGREDLELSILLVDDETIGDLNRQWRNKDKPTDVLSFPQDFPPREFSPLLTPEEELERALLECKNCKLLGDIVISVETAQKQAKALGLSLEEELKRLLLHGFVHLLGFDHETSLQAEEKFRRLEEFLLEKAKES
ncbi:MAG TPA: rRNA maturation RNase YbeY [Aquifex aeolicus]|uniref:Endoribonuclease YbeY n=1 Tax=Aquifex aeolicus TaxID=63363 RepID=A0A9D0YPT6_AQUAO|nr:rRNA maturation RNase YbeY [Aquificales bacterium]HIP98811.1 rRNA maturation RNase YbeY [Aquifex aeolicus]HIQ25784.1 rRNA maturation RNase YbeY [Aquifex aeolicus]